jgi:hypothetical protein
MGGPGSGNHYHWWRPGKKTVVEDCRSLDANRWMREGILKAGVWNSGRWCWYRDAQCREVVSSIEYEVDTTESGPWVRLRYTFTASGVRVDYQIPLAATRPRFGGRRWWFVCPLLIRGQECCRRVGKLYLPPGSRYFGCRHCHGLTYRSAQEHDKRVDLLRRNPAALEELLGGEVDEMNLTRMGLALKAFRKEADDLDRLDRRRRKPCRPRGRSGVP